MLSHIYLAIEHCVSKYTTVDAREKERKNLANKISYLIDPICFNGFTFKEQSTARYYVMDDMQLCVCGKRLLS